MIDERQLHILEGFFLAFHQISSFHDWKCSCSVSSLPAAPSLAAALAEQLERLQAWDRESGMSEKWGFRIPIAYEPAEAPFTDEAFDSLIADYLAPEWLTEDARRAAAGSPPVGRFDDEVISDFMDLSEWLWVPTVRRLLTQALGGEPIVARQVAIGYSPQQRAGVNEQQSFIAIEGPEGRLSLSFRCSD